MGLLTMIDIALFAPYQACLGGFPLAEGPLFHSANQIALKFVVFLNLMCSKQQIKVLGKLTGLCPELRR